MCIFVRSVFRVAELSEGFGGKLANQQVTFMILEGAMIVVACVCLTGSQPGLVFGTLWKEMGFNEKSLKRHGSVTESEERGSNPPVFGL